MFRHFQTKLVLFFVALFAAVQVVTYVAVYSATTRNVVTQVQDQLIYASRIFNLQIEDHALKHSDAARILAADFGFREAVTSADRATVLSAISNLGTRIKADRVMLVSLDNTIIADTRHPGDEPKAFPFPNMIEVAEEQDKAVGMVVMDGGMHELVVVPVLAPVPIAWLVIGVQIDDTLANYLKGLSPLNLDLSFIYQTKAGRWQPLASTLNGEQRAAISDLLVKQADIAAKPVAAYLGAEDYVALVTPLKTPAASFRVAAVLQYSLDAAMHPYRPLLTWLLILTGVGLLLSLLGGVLIARGVTKPVRTLANAAHRMEQGDYTQSVALTQKDEMGHLAAAFNHMMTGIAEREEKIRHQAYHDAVTGLPNRLLFEARLQAMIERAKREDGGFTVILVSIDRFADISNTLGHDVGDRLIQHIGERLQSDIKQSDTTARLATDEFILLVPDIEAEQARFLADRIVGTFDRPFNVDGVSIDVSTHTGIASYPAHGENPAILMQHADVAMYMARRAAIRYAIYDPQKDIYSRTRLSLMGELRQGLKRNELLLYYQPKIDIATNRATHVEALVRWMHPRNGFMMPDEFIPLAEQTGHIQELTAWCMQQAIEQCSLWRQAGIELNVAVNLSARDLPNRRLRNVIADLLTRFQLEPQWLVLELTESAIMQDPEHALNTLKSFSDMGLKLSVDDFGIGYSSMAYLKKLPVHELKIDKSFVIGLAKTPEDEIIVRSTIDLGHNLGLKVVAEGVENEAALNILKRYGCDMAQGYFFGKPMSIERLTQWLNTSPCGMGQRRRAKLVNNNLREF